MNRKLKIIIGSLVILTGLFFYFKLTDDEILNTFFPELPNYKIEKFYYSGTGIDPLILAKIKLETINISTFKDNYLNDYSLQEIDTSTEDHFKKLLDSELSNLEHFYWTNNYRFRHIIIDNTNNNIYLKYTDI